MSRVILVRHGESVMNREHRYSGQRETSLTQRGEAQHRCLHDRLAAEPIDRVVCSDLARCLALGVAIAEGRGLQVERAPALREASFGTWEGLTYEEALSRDRAAMVAFNRDQVGTAPPGGESLVALTERVRSCFQELLRAHKGRDGALLLVSHGGTLRALLCDLLAIPLARYWTLRIDLASLTILDLYPMGPIMAVLNDTCHLQGLDS